MINFDLVGGQTRRGKKGMYPRTDETDSLPKTPNRSKSTASHFLASPLQKAVSHERRHMDRIEKSSDKTSEDCSEKTKLGSDHRAATNKGSGKYCAQDGVSAADTDSLVPHGSPVTNASVPVSSRPRSAAPCSSSWDLVGGA